MIAKQTVYLSSDRTKAVPAGDTDAKFLLVREGHEIEDAAADQYKGAPELIGSKATGKAAKADELVDPPVPAAPAPAPTPKAAATPKKVSKAKSKAKK